MSKIPFTSTTHCTKCGDQVMSNIVNKNKYCVNTSCRMYAVTVNDESNKKCIGSQLWERNVPDPKATPNISDDRPDMVNHPPHYTSHPSGIECIQITQYMGFCLGNAMKYIWRAYLKGDVIEDLKKAAWYIQKEIDKREAESHGS